MTPLKKKEYEQALEPLQREFNDLAHWLKHTGKRMLVLLEGRDTAHVPAAPIEFPPLSGKPAREHFAAPVRPLKDRF